MHRHRLLATSFLLALVVSIRATAAIQPPVLKWQDGGCTSWCQTGWYASPAVADLDGNGTKEVIWSAYDVFVLDGSTGATIWNVPNGHDKGNPGSSVGRTWPGVVVADIDSNGSIEIVTSHSDGWVSVYDGNGYFRPGWPKQVTPGAELRTLAVFDVEGDGQMEIGVAATQSEDQWYLLEPDGSVRPGWPQLPAGGQWAAGCYNENIAFGDVDGDGVAEVFAPNDTHYVDAFYADGSSIPANAAFPNGYWRNNGVWVPLAAELQGWGTCGPDDRPNWNSGGLIVVDLDGNGVNEVLGVGNVHDCSYSPYLDIYMLPWIWKGDRSRWSNGTSDWTVVPTPPAGSAPLSEDWTVIENCMPNAVAADIDGDGAMEILYAAYDGRLHCMWLDKTEHGNWPIEVYNPAEGFYRFATEPAVADLDGDGTVEVIFGDWPAKASLAVGYLHVADAGGNEIVKTPVPSVAGDYNGILAAPTLDDIDGDADLEAVMGTVNSGAIAFDLPGTASARLYWPTGRGNYQRSGSYLSYPVTASFDASPKQGPAPLAVAFTDSSSGNPTSWSWTFGDGNSATTQNPSHTYVAPGLYTVSLTVSNGTASDTLTRGNLIDVTASAPDRVLAGAGPGAGNPNTVKLLEPDGTQVAQLTAYAAGSFGTNVRSGNVTAALVPSILTGPGPGPVFGPQVRAFAESGSPIAKINFYAYGTLKYGVAADGGDVEGDAYDEIVTGAGPGAVFGPHVRAFNFDNATIAAIAKVSFFAYGTLKYGVNVASGSIDLDVPAEIVTGAGPGAIFAATVRAFNFDGATLAAIQKVNFNAQSGSYGINVALGGLDADLSDEILSGRGPGPVNDARVRGWNFDGASLTALSGLDGTPFATLYGVQVASGDMTGLAPEDVQAGAGADPAADALHSAYVYTSSALQPLSYATFTPFPGTKYGLKVGDDNF